MDSETELTIYLRKVVDLRKKKLEIEREFEYAQQTVITLMQSLPCKTVVVGDVSITLAGGTHNYLYYSDVKNYGTFL